MGKIKFNKYFDSMLGQWVLICSWGNFSATSYTNSQMLLGMSEETLKDFWDDQKRRLAYKITDELLKFEEEKEDDSCWPSPKKVPLLNKMFQTDSFDSTIKIHDQYKYHQGGAIPSSYSPPSYSSASSDIVQTLKKYFDCLEEIVNPPDGVQCTPCKLMDMVVYLNDHKKWTREQIADWLETLDLNITMKE